MCKGVANSWVWVWVVGAGGPRGAWCSLVARCAVKTRVCEGVVGGCAMGERDQGEGS